MKTIAALLLVFSLPGLRSAPPLKRPVFASSPRTASRGGRWYFADNGHAVYCYGPVVVMPQPLTGLRRVATFCQGDKPMVLLKD